MLQFKLLLTERLKNNIYGSFNYKVMRPACTNNTVKITGYILVTMIQCLSLVCLILFVFMQKGLLHLLLAA